MDSDISVSEWVDDRTALNSRKPETTRHNNYRLRNQEILVTWSQIDETRFPWTMIIERFKKLNAKCRIGREHHQDGGLHYHAYAKHVKRFNTRDQRFLDIAGYHPNIRPVTHHHARAWKYVAKHNLVHDDLPDKPHGKTNKSMQIQVFQAALQAPTHKEMLRIIREGDPVKYCTGFTSIKSAADHTFPKREIPSYTSPPGLQIQTEQFPDLQQWVDTWLPNSRHATAQPRTSEREPTPALTCNGSSGSEPWPGGESESVAEWDDFITDSGFTEPDSEGFTRYAKTLENPRAIANCPQERPMCLVLHGPTRLGKTLFARSLGRHTYFGGTFNLRMWDPECEYVVIDDNPEGLRGFNYKDWLGCQHEFSATDKYMHKMVVPLHNRPTILVCNQNPLDDLHRSIDRDWLVGNCIFVQLDKPICSFAI